MIKNLFPEMIPKDSSKLVDFNKICSPALFGDIDPLPNVKKSCYLGFFPIHMFEPMERRE